MVKWHKIGYNNGKEKNVRDMCKLPKGNADFKKIRKEGFVYVDKTRYLELLEHTNNTSVHFLRPRRFAPLVRRAEKAYSLP